jgi:hypothetical protein
MSKPPVKRLKTTKKKKDQKIWLDLLSEDLLPHILSFVGDHQYGFIGTVNHAFRDAYLSLYPDCKMTYYNVSSMKLAEFCSDGVSQNSFRALRLCEVAAKHNFKVFDLFMTRYAGPSFEYWEHLCAAAAGAGRLETLEWLQNQGYYSNEWTCANAAAGGHVKVLKWLHAEECEWDWQTCAEAAGAGHLKVLKWLRSKDCPWCPLTCAYAAMNGHLHILKWAHKNGCYRDHHTCIFAFEKGQWECFHWAVDHGYPIDDYFEWDESSGSLKRKDDVGDVVSLLQENHPKVRNFWRNREKTHQIMVTNAQLEHLYKVAESQLSTHDFQKLFVRTMSEQKKLPEETNRQWIPKMHRTIRNKIAINEREGHPDIRKFFLPKNK